jgi:rfaE bifunctional protein nucleotidyltransferase chain/domain
MNIWTNGCFDILHTGHIELLNYAKNYQPGDVSPVIGPTNLLYVGLDTDERVKRLKGDKRPINDINTRLTIMRNLRMVDGVFIFDTDNDLRNLIKYLLIDYMIVGDQYKDKEVIGNENSKYGVVYYPVDMRSTTNIIEKIKNLDKENIINLVCFDIEYNNETIKMEAYPYDIMTNKMMFNEYFPKARFYELEVLEYISARYKGGVALDIGANIGNHSIFFSKFIFDKTYSFEADVRNFTLLSENKVRNNIGDDKLIIHNVALSDGNYKYNLQEFESNMGGTKVIEGSGEPTTQKLDEFELPKVDFIKIDVEGHELKVLKGAVNLINRDFPDIAMECLRDGMYPDCHLVDSYMEQLNYRLTESFFDYGIYFYKHKQ